MTEKKRRAGWAVNHPKNCWRRLNGKRLSFLHSVAEYTNILEVAACIYHLCDSDPSGVNTGEKIGETPREIASDSEFYFARIAVPPWEIEERHLPAQPKKMPDSRSSNFRKISVEFSTISPDDLCETPTSRQELHQPPRKLAVLKAEKSGAREHPQARRPRILRRGMKRRAQPTTDRERRKRLWLDPVFAQLNTREALELARKCSVSLRMAAHVAGLIVNLPSFLDRGYIYASPAGLAKHIKNDNGARLSARQARRCIEFLRRCGQVRLEARPGKTNLLYPIYSAVPPSPGSDIMAKDSGHDGQTPRTSCPTNPNTKPLVTPLTPQPPNPQPGGRVIRPAERSPVKGISFDDFYNACSNRHERDPKGPAIAAWNKLNDSDRTAIAERARRDGGGVDLNGVFAVTWLAGRRWEAPPVSLGVFVEKDSDDWFAWCEHWREHGRPNGSRRPPTPFWSTEHGKEGYYCPSTRPARTGGGQTE